MWIFAGVPRRVGVVTGRYLHNFHTYDQNYYHCGTASTRMYCNRTSVLVCLQGIYLSLPTDGDKCAMVNFGGID